MSANLMTGAAGNGGALAHRTGLHPVGTTRYVGGFGNIFKKEMQERFRPRMLIIQAVIWLAVINGMLAFVLFVVPLLPSESGRPIPRMDPFFVGLPTFFSLLFQAGAIGAVITAQDEIVGEKQTGTAAWILSKPVTRFAFVLAKLAATGIGLLVFVVALTSAVAYAEVSLPAGRAVYLLPYVGGIALVALSLLYFLSLTIMLGTLFNQRAPVIAIPLGVLFGAMILVSLVSQVGLITPIKMYTVASALVTGGALPSDLLVTVVITIISIVVFSGVAMWRFDREEF